MNEYDKPSKRYILCVAEMAAAIGMAQRFSVRDDALEIQGLVPLEDMSWHKAPIFKKIGIAQQSRSRKSKQTAQRHARKMTRKSKK